MLSEMHQPYWEEGIPGGEKHSKESTCSGDSEKLSVTEDKLVRREESGNLDWNQIT